MTVTINASLVPSTFQIMKLGTAIARSVLVLVLYDHHSVPPVPVTGALPRRLVTTQITFSLPVSVEGRLVDDPVSVTVARPAPTPTVDTVVVLGTTVALRPLHIRSTGAPARGVACVGGGSSHVTAAGDTRVADSTEVRSGRTRETDPRIRVGIE